MGFDFSLPIGQIEEEIAVIEAGLEGLNRAPSAGTPRREQPRGLRSALRAWRITPAGFALETAE
jgi:hypothetical protein